MILFQRKSARQFQGVYETGGVLFLLLFGILVCSAGDEGIKRVYLKDRQVRVEACFLARDNVRLLQLQTHQDLSNGKQLSLDWRWKDGVGMANLGRFADGVDAAFCRFQLIDMLNSRSIGQARWVENIESLSKRTNAFPSAEGIKGLQCIEDINDAIRLGIKQAALNVTLDQLIDWQGKAGSMSRQVNNQQVFFHANYVAHIDSQLKRLTEAGVVSSLIIYNRIPRIGDGSPLVHPKTDLDRSKSHVGAFNLTTEKGVLLYRAAIEFLADRYSNPINKHGLAKRFIIGNEIQSHWHWYNLGELSMRQVVAEYHKALRLAHLAAHSIHPGIQLYISMDHHWSARMGSNPLRGMSGRYFIETLNAVSNLGGNFDWHVAFHPYPENLFEPKTWLDNTAIASFDTKKITFKNIQVLPAFLQQERFLYKGKRRRVILSEQGFHSADGAKGEIEQAAAYAYAYYRVRHTEGVDAFILHRHVDHPGEGGLRLGLRSSKDGGFRHVYEVFRRADTSEWREAFQFALPIIGVKTWPETLP